MFVAIDTYVQYNFMSTALQGGKSADGMAVRVAKAQLIIDMHFKQTINRIVHPV